MLTFDTKTSLYSKDRGIEVPMVLEYDYIPHHTYKSFFRSRGLLDWSTLFFEVIKHTRFRDTTLNVKLYSEFTTQVHVYYTCSSKFTTQLYV
jgi:hypothetical protein